MQVRISRVGARMSAAVLILVTLLLTASFPVAHAQDDVEEANKATVERFFQELINEGNLDVIDDLIAPGYVEHFAAEDTVYDEPQVLKDEWEGILAEFSPIEFQLDDMLADGDRVITRFTASAMDGAAVWTGIGIHRLEDGQIVEYWEQADQISMMMAMGMLPDVETQEANKAVIRRMMDEVVNEQNLDAVEELYAPDYVEHGPMGDFEATGFRCDQGEHCARSSPVCPTFKSKSPTSSPKVIGS